MLSFRVATYCLRAMETATSQTLTRGSTIQLIWRAGRCRVVAKMRTVNPDKPSPKRQITVSMNHLTCNLIRVGRGR